MIYNKEEYTFDAILNLVGGGLFGFSDGTKMKYRDGQTPPTQEEIDAELIRMQAEYDAQEYARDRASAYDSVGDQLEMLMKDMKNGTTTHQTACEAVKAKYPKP